MIKSRAKDDTIADWWYGDRDWFAVDAVGQLAAFITAGQGDVPTHLLPRYSDLERICEEIENLPLRGDCTLLHEYPRPDDFLDYARRGIFAYDWMEVHMTANQKHHYYLIARPHRPLTIGELSSSCREVFSLVQLETVRFTDGVSFSVREAIRDVTVA